MRIWEVELRRRIGFFSSMNILAEGTLRARIETLNLRPFIVRHSKSSIAPSGFPMWDRLPGRRGLEFNVEPNLAQIQDPKPAYVQNLESKTLTSSTPLSPTWPKLTTLHHESYLDPGCPICLHCFCNRPL